MLLRDGFSHVFKKHVAIGRPQTVRIRPVHLELAIGVLVVVLIGAPTEGQHGVTDVPNHREAAHQRRLIIAGLALRIVGIGDGAAVGGNQKILALHTGHHRVARLLRFRNLALQGDARRGFDRLTQHPQIGRQPGNLRLPGQLHQAFRIGKGEHIGVGRGHVQPGGKARKTRPVVLHLANGRSGDELGAQHPEQIDKTDQKIRNASVLRDLRQISGHWLSLLRC